MLRVIAAVVRRAVGGETEGEEKARDAGPDMHYRVPVLVQYDGITPGHRPSRQPHLYSTLLHHDDQALTARTGLKPHIAVVSTPGHASHATIRRC